MKAPAGQNEVMTRLRSKHKRWVLAGAEQAPGRRVLLTFSTQVTAARELQEEGLGQVVEIEGDQWFQLN